MGNHKQEHGSAHEEVPIQIDNKPHRLSSPTTGATLYNRGPVLPGYDLWREVRGQGDDEFIPNDSTGLQLSPGDRFYSAQSSLNPGEHHHGNG